LKPDNYYNMYKDKLVIVNSYSKKKLNILTLSDAELSSLCRYRRLQKVDKSHFVTELERRVKVLES
jgi:hypothetical protein